MVSDVLVIGAGLTGLTAAAHLERSDRSVVVLEAGPEVGGRMRSRWIGSRRLDLGAELVGRHYVYLRRLVTALGLHLVPGSRVPPRLRVQPEVRNATTLRTLTELRLVQRHLRSIIAQVDLGEPWSTPGGRAADAVPVDQWLREDVGVSPDTVQILDTVSRAFTLTTLDRLSLLGLVLWVGPAGGLPALWQETGSRITEGAGEICHRLAGTLRQPVQLNSPVTRVEIPDAAGPVRVHIGNQTVRLAHRVAVCVPLATVSTIAFEPSAPETTTALSAIASPSVVKLVGTPRHSRKRNLYVVGDAQMPLLSVDAQHAVGFAYGSTTARPRSELHERFRALLMPVADLDEVCSIDWGSEPFAMGGYPAFGPGQLVRHGPSLRAAHGPVLFGGADRSTWPGTMEGAVRDGLRIGDSLATTTDARRVPTHPENRHAAPSRRQTAAARP